LPKLIQCIPNFSTSRRETAEAIAAAIRSEGEVQVLDLHWDVDHARAVITFVGPPYSVREAILAGVTRAVQLIDLREHVGEHPRIGAADVIPLVPLKDVTLQQCVRLSHAIGEDLAGTLGVPVYFYELSARRANRTNLYEVRKGGFEELRRLRLAGMRKPDTGPDWLHPSAGATVVGARRPLIAFNVNLNTDDTAVARKIAAEIRRVRDAGAGLHGVKALGIHLSHRSCAQVSTNITQPDDVTMADVLNFVEREAEAIGVDVSEIELVGMVRLKHYEAAKSHPLIAQGVRREAVLEHWISHLPTR
jgi:glutamate formiminotransferase